MERRELWIGAKAGAVTGLLIGGFFIPSLVPFEALIWYSGSLVKALPAIVAGYLLVGMILLGAITMIPVVLILSLIGASFMMIRKWIPGGSVTVQSVTLFLLIWVILDVCGLTYFTREFLDIRFVGFTLFWDLLFALVFVYLFRRFSRKGSSVV